MAVVGMAVVVVIAIMVCGSRSVFRLRDAIIVGGGSH